MSSSSPQNSGEPSGLLRTLLAAFSGVLFGMLLPRPKTPIQEPVKTEHPGIHTDDSRNKTEPPSPIRVAIESYPPPTVTEEENSEQTWRNRREWGNFIASCLTALFAGGLLAVTSIYADYTYRMWSEMNKQTDILHGAQRPWVGLEGFPQITSYTRTGTKIEIGLSTNIKNFGASPAFWVQPGFDVRTENAPLDELEIWQLSQCHKGEWFGYTLFPTAIHNEETTISVDMRNFDLTKRAVFAGCVFYRNIFTEDRTNTFVSTTRICYRAKESIDKVRLGEILESCPWGNDAD